MHINKVIVFNSTNDGIYTNPEQRENGKIVLIDISASMSEKISELKLCYSMVEALSGIKLPPIPAPKERTNLIGLLMELVRQGIGQQEFLVLTDGEDNFHDIRKIPTSVADDGSLVETDIGEFERSGAYEERRQTAILDYITNVLKADVHLIGVGNEVKHLLRMAASRPIVVAHVRPRANANEVASVMRAAVSTRPSRPSRPSRPAQLSDASAAPAAAPETAAAAPDVRIITIDNLGEHGVAPAELVDAVVANAPSVSVGGDVWTKDEAIAKFEEAEALAYADDDTPYDAVTKYNRRVVVELLKLSETRGPIPGAIVGSKYRSLFDAPGKGKWKINKLLYQLKQVGFLLEDKQHNVQVVVEGKDYNFMGDRAYSCYKPSASVESLVAALDTDADFCAAVDALKRTQPPKRKSNAGSASDDAGSPKKQNTASDPHAPPPSSPLA